MYIGMQYLSCNPHPVAKIIPSFMTEKAALKLVFSVLIRAASRWHRVSFTDTERNYLDKLRAKLGIQENLHAAQELKEAS